jgi:hypothetical protein
MGLCIEKGGRHLHESAWRPATFEEGMRAAFEDMYEDTLISRRKEN